MFLAWALGSRQVGGACTWWTEDTEIVVYCRDEYCVFAHDAVRLLTESGRRAIRPNDGMLEWRLADLPVDTGQRNGRAHTPVPRSPG